VRSRTLHHSSNTKKKEPIELKNGSLLLPPFWVHETRVLTQENVFTVSFRNNIFDKSLYRTVGEFLFITNLPFVCLEISRFLSLVSSLPSLSPHYSLA
jgi:hypothetical protein